MDRIPTEADWENYQDDIETRYAYGRFAGKSLNEVQEYFRDAVLGASESLSYMPKIPFQFYVMGYKQYLEAVDLNGERVSEFSDAASSFLLLIQSRLKNTPEIIMPVIPTLLPVAEYLALNQGKIDASAEIYGSFPDLIEAIKLLVSKHVSMNITSVERAKLDYQIALNSFEQAKNSAEKTKALSKTLFSDDLQELIKMSDSDKTKTEANMKVLERMQCVQVIQEQLTCVLKLYEWNLIQWTLKLGEAPPIDEAIPSLKNEIAYFEDELRNGGWNSQLGLNKEFKPQLKLLKKCLSQMSKLR